MNKLILSGLTCISILTGLCSCNQKEEIKVDYASATLYEAALNSGEDTVGKVITFIADDLKPDSAFGYNIIAEEHLNFISDFNPNVKVGDELTIKVTNVLNFLSSWLISYEKIK